MWTQVRAPPRVVTSKRDWTNGATILKSIDNWLLLTDPLFVMFMQESGVLTNILTLNLYRANIIIINQFLFQLLTKRVLNFHIQVSNGTPWPCPTLGRGRGGSLTMNLSSVWIVHRIWGDEVGGSFSFPETNFYTSENSLHKQVLSFEIALAVAKCLSVCASWK